MVAQPFEPAISQASPFADLDAERATLGAVMLDSGCLHLVRLHVAPGDFASERHQRIAEGMWAAGDRGEPAEIIVLRRELEGRGTLVVSGGIDYLADLAASCPSTASVEHYARIVAETSWRRRMREGLGLALQELGRGDDPSEVEATIDRARAMISMASRPTMQGMHAVMGETFERVASASENGGLHGLSTGLAKLDGYLAGLRPGRVYILAARPSLGKSALGFQVARTVAGAGKRVYCASAEMPSEEVADRLICWQSGVPSDKLLSGGVTQAVGDAIGELAGLPMWVDDKARISVGEIRARCRYLQAQGGLGLVVIDYAQLLSPERRHGNRNEDVASISGDVKALAKELGVPVLLLSQLNRLSERGEFGEGRRPRLSDLRESGSLEQDADVVMFLWRDPKAVPRHDRRVECELIVAKHRGGPKGRTVLLFDGPRFRFSEA